MRNFRIVRPDGALRPLLQQKIDNLTKPKGSLGMLERIALRVGMIQQSLTPALHEPQNLLFAADHGVVEEGISLSPKEITWQQTLHFVRNAGTGIGFLCRQHGFELKVIDGGVDFDFPAGCGIIDRKIRKGTSNYLYGSAMTPDEFDRCIDVGAEMVDLAIDEGCNIVSFGEMGITNTSSSSIWMHFFADVPLDECIGAGSGLDSAGIRHKCDVLRRAVADYAGDGSVADLIRWFGGFEMVMAVGGMLRAAERRITILVDGFIMSACILAASKLYPEVLDYALFGHVGDEQGHRRLLEAMDAEPILHLGLRLGEGSGAVCAYPIVESAVRMLNEMDSFQAMQITKYF